MAQGVIEKGNRGLYQNEIELNGKYATMARTLKDDLNIISTFREVYIISTLIGFLNQQKGTPDTTEKVQPASIFPTELNSKKPDLRFMYRIMMLVDENPEYDIEDYMKRTFRDEIEYENNDFLKKNMELINSYTCGGLEYLYNKFENCHTIESRINTLYDLVHNISVDIGLLENDELPDFTPNFG